MIEIKNLAVNYGKFTAVKDLNFTVNDGEFFTFLGPSGCGKTTTLRCISGFEKATAGQIIAYGRDISEMLPEERNIGFVFQSYALFPSMNVYENIAFGLKAHKVNRKAIRDKVEDVAKRTGIVEHLGKKVSELSGGQQQRIAVARALVLEPKILLMDEPLSNLDAKLRVSMREEIKRLQKELKITTIYVTHDQEEALAISDRIAVFNVGRIEQIGTPLEIYRNPETEFVAQFIGDTNKLSGEMKQEICKSGGWPDGTSLYIRPQDIRVNTESQIHKEGSCSFPMTVKAFEYQGAYSKVKLQTEDNQLTSMLFSDYQDFKVDEPVYVGITLKDVLAFGGEAYEH